MDSVAIIRQYITIKSQWLLLGAFLAASGVVALFFELLLGVILVIYGSLIIIVTAIVLYSNEKSARKSIMDLASKGLLEKAASEMTSPSATVIGKNKALLTENFLFVRSTGTVYDLREITWAYKHKFTQLLLFIPVFSAESLMLACGSKKIIKAITFFGKDKKKEIENIVTHILTKNPNVLVGFTPENRIAHKEMYKKKKL